MKLRLSYPTLFCLLLPALLSGCFLQSRPQRAERQLLKKEFSKTEQLLRKDLEKDSLNPAAYWLLSRLYLDTAYQQHIDTAHLYILQAIRQAPLESTKDKKRWRKIGLDSTSLVLQHQRVDSAAFVRASRTNTLTAYQYFIDNFPLAQERQEATERRNALAFAAAEAANTWQAYQQFFQTYPLARQVPEARERYEELLFKERTRTGTLQAYRRFLAEHPQTPYRDRLLRNIYKLSTAAHTPQSYARYIRMYPNSPYSQQALVQLYYLHSTPEALWAQYPEVPRPDSLATFIALANQQVIPVLQAGKWGFISETGTEVLPLFFDDVHPDYLCESIEQQYAEVFAEGQSQLVAWNGQVLLKGEYENIHPLSDALLRVQQHGRQGLLLTNGTWLLQPDFSAIRWLGRDLLLAQQGAKSGLIAPNGQWLLPLQTDSLARLQDFVLRFQKGRIAVTTHPLLVQTAQENLNQSPLYQYESVKLFGDSLLLAIRPDSSWQVLNSTLTSLAQGKEALPQAIAGGLAVPTAEGHLVLNKSGSQALPEAYQQLYQRYEGLATRHNNYWSLWQLPHFTPLAQGYDSLQLLHPKLLWQRTAGRDSLLFINSSLRIPLQQKEAVRILRPQYVADSLKLMRSQYDKIVVGSGKSMRVYNLQGHLLLQGRYDDIQAPDPALFIVKNEQGAASLIDTSGQVLLKPLYDAIGNYNDGYLALLKNNRFGTISPYQNILMSPRFDAVLRPYNQQLLTASKSKRWGLINLDGKVVLEHRYDDVRFWTDSIALVQEEGVWQLLSIYNSFPLVAGIIDIEWLRTPTDQMGGIAILETNAGYGIASTRDGLLAAPVYNDIQNLGSAASPLFYLEQENKEQDIYTVSYMNGDGKIIFRNTYSRPEWELLLCD